MSKMPTRYEFETLIGGLIIIVTVFAIGALILFLILQ